MDARRVHEDHLHIVCCVDAHDLIARRLRFGAGDGDLLFEDVVEERGFAHIGATDNGNKAAPVIFWELCEFRQQVVLSDVVL